jgi:hypothetical protein
LDNFEFEDVTPASQQDDVILDAHQKCAGHHNKCDATDTGTRSNELDPLKETRDILRAEIQMVVDWATYQEYYRDIEILSLDESTAIMVHYDPDWHRAHDQLTPRYLSGVLGREVAVVWEEE